MKHECAKLICKNGVVLSEKPRSNKNVGAVNFVTDWGFSNKATGRGFPLDRCLVRKYLVQETLLQKWVRPDIDPAAPAKRPRGTSQNPKLTALPHDEAHANVIYFFFFFGPFFFFAMTYFPWFEMHLRQG